MRLKALIVSIKGIKLSRREEILFLKEKPWGVILFKRNLKSKHQIKKLISKIKKLTKNPLFPVLIDEEGESVSRLSNLITHNISSRLIGNLYHQDKNTCIKLLDHYIFSLSKTLSSLGINTNTMPVLDVLRNNTNKIIGSRSFSKNQNVVKSLGELTIKLMHSYKICSVIKHIPGHGASTVDSHKQMPSVPLNVKKLNEIDFYPFKSTKALLGMTAHILYTKLDSKNVATFSRKIIKEVIRKKIGFKGILMSDDISMKALKYDIVTNAKKSINAGCNLVLYCAGNTNDNFKLIKSLPYIDNFTSKKTSEFFKFLR